MVKEIKTVADVDPDQFDLKVNALIASGYILTNISVLPVRERVVFVASIVKEEGYGQPTEEQPQNQIIV